MLRIGDGFTPPPLLGHRAVVLAYDVGVAALSVRGPLAPDLGVERVHQQLLASHVGDRTHGGAFVGAEGTGAFAVPRPRGGH